MQGVYVVVRRIDGNLLTTQAFVFFIQAKAWAEENEWPGKFEIVWLPIHSEEGTANET